MFCRDKEATAVATALHGYDYPALREDRGFSLIPGHIAYLRFLVICTFFIKTKEREVSARIVLPFSLQTYRHSFHRFFKV